MNESSEVVANPETASVADEKNYKITAAVSKGFVESFIGSLPDKVGKDVKSRLGTMRSRLTVEEFITILGEIISSGGMTKMITLKDISTLQNKKSLEQ